MDDEMSVPSPAVTPRADGSRDQPAGSVRGDRRHLYQLGLTLMLLLVLLARPSARPMMGATTSGALSGAEAQAGFCDGVTEIPRAECEALVALYESTDGPNWKHNDNWLETTTPCDWYGVGCAEVGGATHVTYLGLPYNNLSGGIPAQLADLFYLEMLVLQQNQLSGEIPPELGTLANLRYLQLYTNQLSGPIPPELGNLSNLEHLLLKSNRLSGTIPRELGSLINLKALYLSCNQLSGPVPDTFTGPDKPDRLRLGYNMLTVPDSKVESFLRQKDRNWWTQTIAPGDVHVVTGTYSSVGLAWTPISYTGDGGYYEISHATTEDGPYTVLGTTVDKNAGGYVAEGLTPCSGCYFRVRTHTPAHGQPGEYTYQQSDLWSDYAEVAVWPLPPIALVSPQDDGTVFDLQPVFIWEHLGGAISYRIQVDDQEDFSSPIIDEDELMTTSYRPAAELPEGTYYWHVQGGNFCGDGPWSETRQFTVKRVCHYIFLP